MKNSRLIYSNFSSRLTDFSYIVRSLWICIGGFALIVVNAIEAESGFSGSVTREANITFIALALFFVFNLFARDNQEFEKIFKCFTVLSCLLIGIWLFYSYQDADFLFYSSIGLVLYILSTTLVTFYFSIDYSPKKAAEVIDVGSKS